MNSMYLAISAWRELLARVFTGFSEQDNVSPEWLVNPRLCHSFAAYGVALLSG